MRVLVACPGVSHPASQVGLAFLEAGILEAFATSFAYVPRDQVSKFARRALGLALGDRADVELERRAISCLPDEKIITFPWAELLRVGLSKVVKSALFEDKLWEWMIHDFDHRVANLLPHSATAVYGYEHACRLTWERAENFGVHRILDMAAPHYSFFESLFAEERKRQPGAFDDSWFRIHSQDARRNEHKEREFQLASLVIANSRFTASTLLERGYPKEKIRVVSLGAPTPSPADSKTGGKAYFLFAGTVSVHKGVPYLLEAWRRIGALRSVELVLAGKWALPRDLLSRLPEGVRFVGHLNRQELSRYLGGAMALTLPSLADGFGMVVTEALAHGTPVIVTENVGAADLVEQGKNGWIAQSGDAASLAQMMGRCLALSPSQREMIRAHALKTAAANSWENYRVRLVRTIDEFFGESESAVGNQ